MALSDVEAVRLKISDRPVFSREEKAQEATGNTYFKLDYENIQTTPAIVVRQNGSVKTAVTDYTVDTNNGSVTFVTAPALGDDLVFEYYHTAWTDDELQHAIDTEGHNTLAAASILLAWSVDLARRSQKETRSGGGGIGMVTISTEARAREMRLAAEAYFKQYQDYIVESGPVEYVTEIAWNSFMAERMAENYLLDNL